MRLEEVLKKSIAFLKSKGSVTARLDAELLLSHGLAWPRVDLYMKGDYPLSQEEAGVCRELIVRRGKGEPVAYITGQKGFYRSDFLVTPDVLIPRPETELLVEEGFQFLKEAQLSSAEIWDLGCGSGCVGLSLLLERPNDSLKSFDISPQAIEVAQKNADNLNLSDRVTWESCDLNGKDWKTLGSPHLIVSNPPYIDEKDPEICDQVREYEPSQALFSEDKGFMHLKTWGDKALEVLQPGGVLLMEFGHLQGKALLDYFSGDRSENASVEVLKDLSSKDRVLKIKKVE